MVFGIQGMAIWRSSSGARKEIWDEEPQSPMDDIQAAKKIRAICRSAADSAEKIARAGDRQDGKHKSEAERYERAARAAMQIAMKISDGLLRDSSVCQIVNLCVAADDLKTARILFRAVQAASIREEVLAEHPMLRQ
jgi:hypothetical protein